VIEIIEISDTNVTYKLLPEDGKTVSLPIFNWDVQFIVTNDTEFTMHSIINENHTFTIDSFYGSMHFKVIEMNATHAIFGMNIDSPHIQFVDQTLIFDITVEKIYKTSTLI